MTARTPHLNSICGASGVDAEGWLLFQVMWFPPVLLCPLAIRLHVLGDSLANMPCLDPLLHCPAMCSPSTFVGQPFVFNGCNVATCPHVALATLACAPVTPFSYSFWPICSRHFVALLAPPLPWPSLCLTSRRLLPTSLHWLVIPADHSCSLSLSESASSAYLAMTDTLEETCGECSSLVFEAPSGDADWAESYLEEWSRRICCFFRSFFLLSCLSGVRLLLRAAPLRSRAPRVNRGIATARRGLRGAPLILFLAVTLPFATAMRPAPVCDSSFAQSHSSSLFPGGVPEPEGPMSSPRRAPPVGSSSGQEHDSPSLPPFSRCPSAGWQVPVVILRFQRRSAHISLHTAAVREADDLVEQTEDEWDAAAKGYRCYAIYPQPALDYPAVLAAPVQHQRLQRVPVCLQVHDALGKTDCWIEFFDPLVSLDDVSDVLADAWRPDMQVFVRDSTVALSDCSCPLRAGDLLRIFHRGAARTRITSVEAKLQRPDLFLRRLDVEGFPSVPDTPGRECLLQPLECPRLLQYSYLPGPSLLEQVMLSHGNHSMGSLRLIWPAQPVVELCIREHFVAHLAGAFPARTTGRVPIFVDSRDVGYSVQCRASHTGAMLLSTFLDSIGLFLPDPGNLLISGTAEFDPRTRVIKVQEGDVVCVGYATPIDVSIGASERAPSIHPPDEHERSAGDGAGPVDQPYGRSACRERSPRLAIARSHEGRSSSGRREDHCLRSGKLWQLIGIRSYLIDPVAAAIRRVQVADFRLQVASSRDADLPLVMQGTDAPAEEYALHGPPGAGPEGPPGSPVGGSSDTEDASSFLPDLLRIRVALVSFQGPTVVSTLWCEEGEAVHRFLVRAEILLNDDPSFLSVLPVDPQPDSEFFTFLLCPKWWQLIGICPFLLHSLRADRHPCLVAAYPGCSAADVIPQEAIPPGELCEAFIPETSDKDRSVLQPETIVAEAVPAGSLVCLRPSCAPLPQARTMQEHLNSLPHVGSAATQQLPERQNRLAVFLGFGFDQFCLQLPFGSVPRHLAASIEVPPESVFLCRQLDPFDSLTVAGSCPVQVFGFRNLSVMGRPFTGRGLFIDPRPLGRPVCFREILVDAFTPRQLCAWLNVPIPDGFQPLCQGGTDAGSGDGSITNYHGETVILWMDQVVPETAPMTAEPASDLSAGPSDSDDASDEDGFLPREPPSGSLHHGRDRSRSPTGGCQPAGAVDAPGRTSSAPWCVAPAVELSAHIRPLAVPTEMSKVDEVPPGNKQVASDRAMPAIVPARTLPTPCRAVHFLPPVGAAFAEGPTLLQQAGLEQANVYLGRVVELVCNTGVALGPLVEAIPAQDPTPAAQTICLSDHLPPPCFHCDVQHVQLVDSQAAALWTHLRRPWKDFTVAFDMPPARVHPNTLVALALCAPISSMPMPRDLHIYTDGSAKSEETGWAAVIVQLSPGSGSVAVVGAFGGRVIVDPDCVEFVGASELTSRAAELTAIIWSLRWLVAHWDSVSCLQATLHFDSTTAGFAASGDWSAGHDTIALKARHLAQAAEAFLGPQRLLWKHVSAHCGHPWNEFADTIADCLRLQLPFRISRPCHCAPPCFGLADTSRLHLLPTSPDARAFPCIRDGVANWAEVSSPLTMMRPEQVVPFQVQTHLQTWTFQCTCLTANLQSAVGKFAYLEQQLEREGVCIAFFQETKSQGGFTQSARFLRFASDAMQHWGTAVWISRQLPIGWLGRHPVYVDAASINVLHSGPRHIVLSATVRGEPLHLCSVHFPHQGRPESERRDLQSTLHAVWSQLTDGLMIAGCDANARVPQHCGFATGGRSDGPPDRAGYFFSEFLATNAWWLPSTFDECHSGTDATHMHPSGEERRIDYFVLPECLRDAEVATWVDRSFDLLNLQEDHFALRMTVKKERVASGQAEIKCKRERFDIQKLHDADTRDRIKARLQGLELPAWEVDVNQHAALFQEQVLDVLRDEIPGRQDAPRSWYLSDQAWLLRQRKHQLRQRTCNRRKDHKRTVMGLAFDVLRSHESSRNVWLRFLSRKACLLYEVAASAIQHATARMRALITREKAEQLARIGQSLGRCHPQELMTRLRGLQLGRRKPKSWKKQLPGLVQEDGIVTRDRGDVDQLWLRYFGQMEAGIIMPMHAFFQQEAAFKPPLDIVMDANLFPTLTEVEQTLREVKPRKTPGLDQIPGDLLRVAAKPLARLLTPLFFKAVAHVRQPVQWRGGVLYSAWKGSGPTNAASSYRSLFVSSAVGKTFHRLVRGKLSPLTSSYFGPCHYGAKPGAPVTHASQLVVAHELWCDKSKQSSATLFLDTRSAYYRVVREAATGMSRPQDLDACVTRVLHHFGLPPSAWETLLSLVKNGGAMRGAGASDHLCAVAEDLQSEAFFVTQFASRQQLCKTHAGSRPGESLADVVFGFIYHEVLQCIREEVKQRALGAPLPYDGQPSLWVGDPQEEVWLTDSTWADDSAFMTRDADAATLLRKAQHLAETVIAAVQRHAMDPNMKPGKTAIMISLRGRGSRRQALKWFGKDGSTLRLSTPLAGEIALHVTASYVHLGLHLDRGATFRPEVLRRLSHARTAFREVRDLVLQNISVPRATRASLFSALVDSTLFNLELWQEDVGHPWTKMVAGHAKLQRLLLSKEMSAEMLLKLTPADVTFILGVPSMENLLRAKRLRYLATLVRSAPAQLWAVLKLERDWLVKVILDLQWFSYHSGAEWPPVDEEHWPLWWHAIKSSVGRFKRNVGVAIKRATLDGLLPAFAAEAEEAMRHTQIAYGRVTAGQDANSVCQQFVCVPCRQPFASHSNLACHFRHFHGRRSDHLHYSGGLLCCGCGAYYHSMNRILTHLKTVPSCWRAVRQAGLVSDEPHSGEGSRARRLEQSACPALVPAIPAATCRIVYDDEPRRLLPREKAVLSCSSRLGGAIEDWVREVSPEFDLLGLRTALWLVVRSTLADYPFYLHEYQESLRQAAADIRQLQSVVLLWSNSLVEPIISLLLEWAHGLSLGMLTNGEDGGWVARLGHESKVSGQDVQYLSCFPPLCGATIVCFGDRFTDVERTRLQAIFDDHSLMLSFCDWDFALFRNSDFGNVAAVFINLSVSWEAKEGTLMRHGWEPFALDAWSDAVELRRAGAVRLVFKVLKIAWRLVFLGRACCFRCPAQATRLLACAPVQRLRATKSWQEWRDDRHVWFATSVADGPPAFPGCWGLCSHRASN